MKHGEQPAEHRQRQGETDYLAVLTRSAAAGLSYTALRPRSIRCPMSRPLRIQPCATREEVLARAHVDSGIKITAIAAEMGLSVGRVSQLIELER